MKRQFNKSIIKLFLLSLIAFNFGLVNPVSAIADSIAPENMVLVNAGGFMRGLDKTPADDTNNTKLGVSNKAFADESPAKMIYLSSYYIDKYEVSNSQYTEFIKATDHPAPAYWDHHRLNKANSPVTGVNWYDANAYCHWANKRLPTEAEWEKAARGPAGFIYPWGNELNPTKANFAKGETGTKHVTESVDSRPNGKSYYGAYNMAGNVFEWVQDWYSPNYYKTSTQARNPTGPRLGIEIDETDVLTRKKVIRGGSWFSPAQSITTTHRFWNDPMNNSYGVGLGFRCAKSKESNSQLEARAFYMNALTHMGGERYQKALIAIEKALKTSPDNKEYQTLKSMIEKQAK
jgi:formylglycine-generating enzyme required for sulfatase activity